ncbi:hypothetical protein A2890_00710 [candidate division WWE3 bacterium RIFCSPLOWO2_01_FULL_53_14]|uniref:Uncharacterized protein n=1 Tax=candidate division WWE3 bacterium RIFCSPLOWO2_01_FULL_53_14 TaxID=1802628 RepID=A0A1F4VSM3_UNCKA|nr:MAG: hypothetical protein A2890_00710 [candidate division WWE3 bacterium RIFCSPLOWO2_01_FULL_53_14]
MKKSIFAPWLIRFYEWYFSVRGSYQPRQENFCRFGRTVFLWAPLYWFFCRRFALGMRPWMPVMLTAYGLMLLAFPVGTLIVGFAILWIWFLIQPKILNPVWKFLTRPVAGRVRVGYVLLVALFAGLSYLSPEGFLTSLVYLVGLVLAVAVIMALVAGLVVFFLFLRDFLREWITFSISIRLRIRLPKVRVSAPPIPLPVRSAAANVGGIFSTAWHFLVVLKRKTICPWVSFQNGRIEFLFAPEPIKE